VKLRSSTVEGFRKRPESAVVVGDGWLYYCVDRGLLGLAAWGVPALEEFRRLEPCLDVALAADAPPHVSILDLRRLGLVGGELFGELARYGEERRALTARRVIRQVVLAPPGYTQALLIGLREVMKPPYEVVFADSEEEATRLSERADAPALFAEIARVIDGPLRVKVAQHLANGAMDVADVAQHFALSARTLQRRLASEGTSFVEIARDVMIERAKELLLSTDEKLEVIARRVGSPSASHFTASFRRATGETPSAWRARNSRAVTRSR
jgi:AraC-like DNA-binding protein